MSIRPSNIWNLFENVWKSWDFFLEHGLQRIWTIWLGCILSSTDEKLQGAGILGESFLQAMVKVGAQSGSSKEILFLTDLWLQMEMMVHM